MPRYELAYILASTVSDDQVDATTAGIKQLVADFGGSDIKEELLGKKKLAYPIKKTRNGFYGVLEFSAESSKLAPLDAKLRTQGANIIRYLIINIDEHIKRTAKDALVQSKMKRTGPPEEGKDKEEVKPRAKKAAPAEPINEEQLNEKIEAALNEEVIK